MYTDGEELRTKLGRKERECEVRQMEVAEVKTELEQLLSKLEEAGQQLNTTRTRETELTNQVQGLSQKVSLQFRYCFVLILSCTHRMRCCRKSVRQWRQH